MLTKKYNYKDDYVSQSAQMTARGFPLNWLHLWERDKHKRDKKHRIQHANKLKGGLLENIVKTEWGSRQFPCL